MIPCILCALKSCLMIVQITQPCWSLTRMERYLWSLFKLLSRKLVIGSPLINYFLTLTKPIC